MTELEQNLQARRAIEDRLIRLGRERKDVERALSANIQAITDAMTEAVDAGIPVEQVSKLVGVSRQTLYRWSEGAIRAS
jgi:transposase-like protein